MRLLNSPFDGEQIFDVKGSRLKGVGLVLTPLIMRHSCAGESVSAFSKARADSKSEFPHFTGHEFVLVGDFHLGLQSLVPDL